MKRTISLVLSIVLILLTLTPAIADSTQEDLYKQSGQILESAKVLKGNASGDLMLEKKLKRQDMVVLVSRLLKEEGKAKTSSPKILFTDVTDPSYKPYINWSVTKGLIVGKTTTKFGFNEFVTVQQLQAVLLRTLGYNEEAKDWDNVPTSATKLGIMNNVEAMPANKEVERGLMATMTVNALRINKNNTNTTLAEYLNITIPDLFTVECQATINRDTLKIEGIATGTKSLKLNVKPTSSSITTGEKTVDVPLQKDGRFSVEVKGLQSGNYNYRFSNGSYYTKYESFTIKELPFELLNVSADSLKEITVNFSKAVDKNSALFLSNYSTDAGNIKDMRLEDEGRKLILTLDTNVTMINQKNYKLSIYNIKSESGEELSIKDETFMAFDNTIPKVVEVKQLGNKILKVYFSEPIKPATNSNFKIDGKRFSGSVRNDNHIVYLTFYTPLNEGTYTLTTTGVEDYVGYRCIDENTPFSVVLDKEPPKLIEARATMEEVILTFDEDIDPSTAVKSNFFWKYGSLKRYSKNVKVSGEEVILDFSNNTLYPNKSETIYVDGVGDYSGNKLRNGQITVVPTLDTSTPEVMSTRISPDGKEITVFYSKNVIGNSRNFYTIKDQNDKLVSIKEITGSGREYKIILFTPLPVGKNTLTIQGVYDTTTIKNPLKPYSTTIEMRDVTQPKVISHSGKDTQIILQFSKLMDVSTLVNPHNYLVKFGNIRDFLPDDTDFATLNDGKMLIITLPSTINGKEVKVGTSGNLTEMQVIGLKDLSGNSIVPEILTFTSSSTTRAKAIDFYDSEPGFQGVFEEPNEIKIRFDQPIASASKDDFTIYGRDIYDIVVDGNSVVTLYLDSKNETAPPTLYIKRNNNMKTIVDLGVEDGEIKILDKVKPRVKDDSYDLSTYRNTIELSFTENLEEAAASLFNRDLIIRDPRGDILPESAYTTSLSTNHNTIKITITNRQSGYYTIQLKDDPQYIMDKSGNKVEPSTIVFNAQL